MYCDQTRRHCSAALNSRNEAIVDVEMSWEVFKQEFSEVLKCSLGCFAERKAQTKNVDSYFYTFYA